MNIRFPRTVAPALLLLALSPCIASAQSAPGAGTLLSGLSNGKPIYVAAGLKSNAGATEPQPNTIPFDCPKGDGRHGAKGILLKINPGNGSTWSFKYVRNHNGEGSVQIIHPVGRGQALVTITAKEIKVGAPKNWSDVGWGGGETKDVNLKSAFKKVFPLSDDKEYNVVSRMTPGGSFEVFFDGELVASGHARGPSPLSLRMPAAEAGKPPQKFSGADLPLVWSPGWAGVIVGPVDGTRNEVINLQFTPSLVEMAAVR